MLEMNAANQEDPILLATVIKNLCISFGNISKVSPICVHKKYKYKSTFMC